MAKLNPIHQSLTLSSAPQLEHESARHLIFLLPSLEGDLTAVARRVWELANASGTRVKLLGLCDDPAEEFSLKRELVTMSAILNDGKVSAETEIVFGRDWVEAVKPRWQTGDVVVCCAEQRAGVFQKPLSQILQSDLDVPLYILNGLIPQSTPRSNWLTQAVALIGFIAIILGFFLLQVRFIPPATNWTIPLEVLSILVEFWLIWIWNNLLG